jgi:septum formation protein
MKDEKRHCCRGRRLVLASSSPRRRQLLDQLGVQFEVRPAGVDEVVVAGEDPLGAARRLAEMKAESVSLLLPEALVLAADTIVALFDEGCWRLLGKPLNDQEAIAMLEAIQGRTHVVVTGFSLRCEECNFSIARTVKTEVAFRPMSSDEIEAYAATGECFDKAGAYGIQGLGGVFVSGIHGSYSNVVGLPICETAKELEACGVWCASMLHTGQ